MKTESILTKNQKKVFTAKDVILGIQKVDVIVTVRYDDECNNKHNSFSITGDVYEADKRSDHTWIMDGCIHEVIEEVFPELAPLIKWQLTNSDGPLYYYSNTLFHARDRTHEGVEIGAPVAWDTVFKFVQYPFTFKEQSKGFWNYLEEVGDFNNITVEPVPYDGGGSYTGYSDNYSLTGFIKENEPKQWYRAPFKTKEEAKEFLEALQSSQYEFIKIPTKWCEAVTPNIEAARSCAIWPDATLKQLQSKEALEARLPALMDEFRAAVESLGMVY